MSPSIIFFFISLTGIFLSNIFIPFEQTKLNFFITTLSPFFLFFLAKLEKKKNQIPVKETIFYLLFIIFSVISVFFAIDREIAFESLLIYISCYFYFIFAFNYKEILNKYLKWFLVTLSIFSCLIFLTDKIFCLNLFQEGASMFLNYGHNQIGNLLVMGIIPIFPNFLSLIFFVFVLFSYSRSAYFSLILLLILKLIINKFNNKLALISGGIILFCIFFAVITTHNIYLTKNKQLIGGRNKYFSYAISSIIEKPLFGVGLDNFKFAVSKRLTNYGENTTTAHNIILDIFAENGILAGIFFTLFLLSINYGRKFNNNLFMLLALTFMFMTDFSYSFNIFLVIWFILLGLNIESKKIIKNIIVPVVIIFCGVQIILFSIILLKKGLWKQSIFIYPLQKTAYEVAIRENIILKNNQRAYFYLNKYKKIFGGVLSIFQEINFYKALGDNGKVISLYEKLLVTRASVDMDMIKQIYYFYIDLYGQPKAKIKMVGILKQLKNNYSKKEKTSDFYKELDTFCIKANVGC